MVPLVQSVITEIQNPKCFRKLFFPFGLLSSISNTNRTISITFKFVNSEFKQGAFILSRKEKAFVWTQQSGLNKIQKYAWPKFSPSFSVTKLVVKEFFLLSLKVVLYYFRYTPLPNSTKDLFFSVCNRIHASVANSFEHYEKWHRELCPLDRRNGGKQELLIMKIHGSLSSHTAV